MNYDSTGKPIIVGSRVKFRGQYYTIKEFGPPTDTNPDVSTIIFEEEQHTPEVATEFSVDRIST